jgi:hypothetical protein
MKTPIIAAIGVLFVGIVLTGQAHGQNMAASQKGNSWFNGSSWFNSNHDDLYRANEFSLDAFGATASERQGHYDGFGHFHRHDIRGGGGGGVEYFFCRYIGVEAESFALANSRQGTASAAGGNLVLRFPIAATGFSPYVFGGGGHEWTFRSESYADGGLGLEYRFTRRFGIFGDGRFMSPSSTHDFGMARLGVRFAF